MATGGEGPSPLGAVLAPSDPPFIPDRIGEERFKILCRSSAQSTAMVFTKRLSAMPPPPAACKSLVE
ncbi:hypothetical protein OO17_03220 [Rhodopseudomonas palustris]|uniref:Uncharacterized protein n=1 Tax=Rhodopseudomonas palustris TaxID=1076 RepID=A0A0D7F3H0_RHOPL|nr:hypothetical protein OO17_03220 [Rhodopseudomonas palustris]